jgi:hypothetical protein
MFLLGIKANYNYAILQLYRILITNSTDSAPDEIIMKCLNAAKTICQSFRRQHFGKPKTYTWGALNELFLVGLTYLYCMWVSPTARELTRNDEVSSACTDCTMVLSLPWMLFVWPPYHKQHLNNTHNRLDISTVPDPKPARVCVSVSELGKGAKVSWIY